MRGYAFRLAVAAQCACASGLAAQTPVEALNKLFTFGVCGTPLCLDLKPDSVSGVNHGLHFIPALETSGGTVITFLSSAIGVSVANTPTSSSSSGTTFRFEGGVPVKTSTSAGPIFGQRAQTLGRGRWVVGLGFTESHFDRLRGVPLGSIVFNFRHVPRPPTDTNPNPEPFRRDFVQMRLNLNVDLLVSTFTATYGLTDGIDLGVTVPFVRTSVSGNSTAEIFLVGGDTLHRFGGTGANPILTASTSGSGVASGLGDIETRLKIRVVQGQTLGLSLLGVSRFATGDEGNLLGAGAFSGRGLGILSFRFGNFNPHGYVGYTVRRGALQTNSVEGNLGFDQLLAPWATMAFDMLGSWQSGVSKIDVPKPVQYGPPDAPFPYTLDVTNIPSQRDNFMNVSFGMKFRTKRGIQIVTNTLVPVHTAGLQASFVWTGGLEYNF
jgi:hypothetical protein